MNPDIELAEIERFIIGIVTARWNRSARGMRTRKLVEMYAMEYPQENRCLAALNHLIAEEQIAAMHVTREHGELEGRLLKSIPDPHVPDDNPMLYLWGHRPKWCGKSGRLRDSELAYVARKAARA